MVTTQSPLPLADPKSARATPTAPSHRGMVPRVVCLGDSCPVLVALRRKASNPHQQKNPKACKPRGPSWSCSCRCIRTPTACARKAPKVATVADSTWPSNSSRKGAGSDSMTLPANSSLCTLPHQGASVKLQGSRVHRGVLDRSPRSAAKCRPATSAGKNARPDRSSRPTAS